MSPSDPLDIDHTGLLSDATLSALQLHHQPFIEQPPSGQGAQQGDEAAAFEPFSDEITEEQLADVKQALITGDDLLLILGEAGSGKTTLLRQLGRQSGLRIQCFSVSGSERFSTLNLFAGMLEAFKRQPPEKLKEILDELIPCLQSMVGRNTLSVIILDDAHAVNETELTQLLSGMLYVNSQDETLIRVALAGSIQFEDRIPDLLPEGADMPYSSLTIDGLTPQRAAAYLAYRLENAGFQDEFPFTERDMASLVDHSNGMPLQLNALTADVLNEKHGRIADNPPKELMSGGGNSFMQSRLGKLALGALATVLIIGGLLMFLPQENNDSADRFAQGSQDSPAANDSSAELKLIDETESVSAPSDSDSGSNSEQASDATTQPSAEAVSVASNETDSATSDSATDANSQTSETDQADLAPSNEDSANNNGNDGEPEPLDSNQQSDAPVVIVAENTADNAENSETEAATDEVTSSDDAASSDQSNTEQEAAGSSDVDTETSDNTTTEGDASDNATAEGSDEETPPSAEVQNEDAAADADSEEALPGSLEPPTWILVQDSELFTVQMSASRDRDSVENFLQRNPLPAPNSIFSFERNGVVWYALVHGLFPTLADARTAVERMPEPALRNQPWIRSIARVQDILRTP